MKVIFFFANFSITTPMSFGFFLIYMLPIIREIENLTGLEQKGWFKIAI